MATATDMLPDFLPATAVQSIRRTPPLAAGRMAVQAAVIIALLLVNKAGLPGNIVFFGILIVMVITSPELAFKAYTISFLGLVANQAIVPKTPFWTVARFLVPLICLLRFSNDLQSLRSSLFQRGYFIALGMFIAVAAILSIMTQYFVEIALLKLFNFAVASTAVLSGALVMRLRKSDLAEWYVTLCLVTVILGLGSIAAGIGNNMRGTGTFTSTFNGPFYHSNCLGPIAAMMVVYLACAVIFGTYRNRWVCVGLAACLIYFMALTQSRTSFASMAVGLFAAIGLSFVMVRRKSIRMRMKVSRLTLLAGLCLASLGVLIADALTSQSLTKAVVAFANKGGRKDEFDLDQALSSRREVIAASWENFRESPLIGIGFEVAKSDFFRQNASLFYAPIEKGFLPVAVLEETGIIGTFFFVIFLLAFFVYLRRTMNIPGFAMLLTFLAVNCGEAMFFAVGGHGSFGWLLVAGGIMLGDFCVEPVQRPGLQSARS